MGKRVAKKTRAPPKNKRPVSRTSESVPQESNEVVITDDKVSIPEERKPCPHLQKAFDLDKFSTKIGSSDPVRCDDCRVGVSDRKGKQGKGKQGKKKGSASGDSKAIWVCLSCGHYSCGGVGLPTTPQSHALRHARQTRHSLVIQWENPQLRWCFPCNTLIPVEKTEENGENKDPFSEVVKLVKSQHQQGQPVDVEDVWFGGRSVTCEIKSEGISSLSGLAGNGSYMVRGMANLGNTCFFNSVMQNLLAMSRLRDYFLDLDSSFGPLTVALKKLFSETNPDTGLRNVINPKSFFGCLYSKAPQFRGYQQHDSHELLRCLLDGLCNEELGFRKRKIASEGNGVSSDPVPTFVDSVFGGQISSTVSCLECEHSSTVLEPFLDLSLPVPTKKAPPKKAQPVSRAKKAKLPPKKNAKSRPKFKRDTNMGPAPSSSNPSACTESTVEKVVSSGDSAKSDAADATTIAAPVDVNSQEKTADPCPANEQDSQNSIVQEVVPSDDFTWLDYIEPETLPYEREVTLENDDVMFIQDRGVKDKVSDDQFIQSNHISLPTEESSLKPDSSSGNPGEDDVPLVVQDSEVILLPYNEENSTTLEIMSGGAEASSSVTGCEQEELGFEGFGDLFTEPEVYGPVAKPSSSNGEEVSASVVGNSSESDPDEVDDSDAPVSVESCLAHFIKPELLTDDNAWHCENCSKTLQRQMLEAKKKVAKLDLKYLVNGEKPRKQSDALCTREIQFPEVKNLSNRNNDTNRDTGGKPDVQCNGKGDCLNQNCVEIDSGQMYEVNPVVPQLEEEKVVSNGAAERFSSSEVQISSSQENVIDQGGQSCNVHESNSSSAECTSNKMQKNDSWSAAGDDQPVEIEDEEVNSKYVKVKRDATKRVLINKSPPILTIHLKRFSQDLRGRLSKLNGHVIFKETIDLRSYMDARCMSQDRYLYRLVGVVEHLGTMRGGHYVAYVRGGPKTGGKPETENSNAGCVWYHASDAYVREVSLEEVLHCEAYILFYEKV